MQLLFLLGACLEPTEGETPTPEPVPTPTVAEVTVGPEGGILDFDGALVQVPAGAVTESVQLTLRAIGPGDLSDVWALEPAGLSFAVPISITLPAYADVPNGAVEWTVDASASRLPSVGTGLAFTAAVSASGTGQIVAREPVVDTFDLTGPIADILFVIDDSCSMAEEQAGLSQGIPAWFASLEERGVDYHIGVTTTDTDANNGAKLIRVPGQGNANRVITSATNNPMNTLIQLINAGTGGSADERGLLAISQVLDTDAALPANAAFRREDAPLDILLISDENDQGGISPQVVRTLLQDMGARLNVVVGVPGQACNNAFEDGQLYINVANATGGTVASICGAYDFVIAELAEDVSAEVELELSQEPDPSSITYSHSGFEGFDATFVDFGETPSSLVLFNEVPGTLDVTYLPVD